MALPHLIDLDALAAGLPAKAAPPQPPSAVDEGSPTLFERLRIEAVTRARLLGWHQSELSRIEAISDENELLAVRDRISGELQHRFAVPPLYDDGRNRFPHPAKTIPLSVYR